MSSRASTAPGYRLKPAPRRRSRSGRRSRVRWDRVGRIVLVLAVFAILASYVRPAVNLFDSWSESKAESTRLERLREQNADLSRRVEALKSPEAALRTAREQGLVAPGEQPYVIRGLGRD